MAKEIKKTNKTRRKSSEAFDAQKIGKLLTNLNGNVKQINTRIDGLDKKINNRIDGLDKKINTRIDGLDKKINTRIDGLDKKINTRIDGLDKNVNQLNGTINHLIDGQLKLDEKIDNLDEKLSEKIDDLDGRVLSVEKRIVSVEGKMNSLEGRMDSVETEMKDGFRTIVSYLISIEDEVGEIKAVLDKKADKKDLDAIEQRVLRLEIELGECKKQIVTAKNRS